MITHILCAVDLTHGDDARAIIAAAGDLAKRYEARLSLVTVLPDFGSSWVATFFKDGALHEAAEAARSELHAIADEVLADHDDVQCIVELGSIHEKVIEAIGLSGADLVVIGAHKPDLKDRIIGPNAAHVARDAPVSVLVLRLGA